MASELKLEFVTLDVFTDTRFLGNPLAVVLVPAKARQSLSQETKQKIAREFNFSETVFLHVPDEPDASQTSLEINIFTIEEELPFAGHPTIGTAHLVLNHLKWTHVDTLVPKAGPIRITAGEGGAVKASIPHDVHFHKQTLRSILSSEGLSHEAQTAIHKGLTEDEDIRRAELDAQVLSIVKGMSFLLVKLGNLEQLAKVSTGRRLNFGAVPNLFDAGPWEKSFTSRYYYVPAPGSGEGGKHQIRTRMVELGFEDPATGSAASALASYLTLTDKADRASFSITQGVEMGRKSDIVVDTQTETKDGADLKLKDLFLGGRSVVVTTGSIVV